MQEEIQTTVFGKSVKLHPRVIQQLVELEETGAITVFFADSQPDENDEVLFDLYRIKFTPREIYNYVDALVNGNEIPPELESLVCGSKPWRYERIYKNRVYSYGWNDEELPSGPLGVVE